MTSSVLVTLKCERGSKTWVAAIEGKSRKFGLAREFVGCFDYRDGERDYLLDAGQLYEVCELGQRTFVIFEGDQRKTLSKKEAIAVIDAKDEARKAKLAAMDDAINGAIEQINNGVRFDSEGGFSLN